MNHEGHCLLCRDQSTRSVCVCQSVSVWACVLVCCTRGPKIPHSTSNKIQQSAKVQLLLDEEPAGDLSKGLNGCASASAAQARALALVCVCCVLWSWRTDRQGRRRYQRQSSPSFRGIIFCIMPPPLAPIFLLSVSPGIPCQLLCVYQRDRLAIKSSQPWFSYLGEIKVGFLRGAFWGLPLSYYLCRVSLPPLSTLSLRTIFPLGETEDWPCFI